MNTHPNPAHERRTDGLDPVRQMWAAGTVLALEVSEMDTQRSTELMDLWDRACLRVRESTLAAPYRAPTVQVHGLHAGDWDSIAREIIHTRRGAAQMRGAIVALITAIRAAGGWDVADRAHAERVGRAMEAMEQALQASLTSADDFGIYEDTQAERVAA